MSSSMPKLQSTSSFKEKPLTITFKKKLVSSNLKRNLTVNEPESRHASSPRELISSNEMKHTVSRESKVASMDSSTTDINEKKGKRGINTMHRIVRRKLLGVRKNVEYNEKGQLHGKAAKELQSYIRVLAHTKIPISIPKWKKVDQEIKKIRYESLLSKKNGVGIWSM